MRRRWIWAAVMMLCAAAMWAQTSGPQIGNAAGRKSVSLNGPWHIIVDPYENGYYDYRSEPRGDGYFQDKKPQGNELVEYDFDKSPTLQVPGDWNSQDPKYLFYEGTIWYKRAFDWTKQPGTRAFVHFGGANYLTDVYLNGKKLGRHEGGFTPFDFEITSLLREKNNSLIVKVDNKRRRDAVPTLYTDWWNYGGITRDVSIVEVPETFVEDYFVQLKKGSTDEVSGWVKLNGAKAGAPVKIAIPEANAEQTVMTDAEGMAKIDFKAKVELWSPESPRLYNVTITAADDKVTERIGFRTIETRGTEILLNGKPLFLRGVSIHEESPLHPGRASGDADARKLLTWVKEMGGNFARLAHYPHSEHMTRMADEMGVLIWSEIPVYWTIEWENRETFENARRQLEENITRDKNRASVVLWSVGNETPVSEARNRFMRGLVERARELDPTRLVTAANERHYADATTEVIDDPLGDSLDVLGCNEYVGWYDGPPEKADTLTWQVKLQKPVIISEFGGDAKAGLHGRADQRWTEEYQQSIYEHQLAMLRKVPQIRGMTPWILMDFRSPRRPLPGIQDYYNRKGLISDKGEKKKAFFTLQKFYREKAAEK